MTTIMMLRKNIKKQIYVNNPIRNELSWYKMYRHELYSENRSDINVNPKVIIIYKAWWKYILLAYRSVNLTKKNNFWIKEYSEPEMSSKSSIDPQCHIKSCVVVRQILLNLSHSSYENRLICPSPNFCSKIDFYFNTISI